MTKKICRTFVLFMLFAFVFSAVVYAREEERQIDLSLSRTNGYGGLNGEIQGSFTISASIDADLQKVIFYFNDVVLGEDTEAPFKLSFKTNIIDPGPVDFSAVGILANDTVVMSNILQRTVLSDEEVNDTMLGLIGPILAVVVIIVVGGLLLQIISGKKGGAFTHGKYSSAGGAVCPKCELPFSRSFFSPNLLVGKLVTCPHCGKFSVLPRASAAALAEAEDRYTDSLTSDQKHSEEKEEDKLQKMIDDSQFDQN
jgi:hypothetical protein